MLIRRATLLDGRVADIRVGDVISDVAPTLTRRHGEPVLDAQLGATLPGLHDHHVHLRSAAAALDSVGVGPPAVHTAAEFACAVTAAQPGADGWLRAVGYHESVAGELDRDRLDAVRRGTPLRVQHRSGALWILNSAALARIGCPDHPDGRLPTSDVRLAKEVPRREPDLSALSRLCAAYGITGVTDATPDLTRDDVAGLTAAFRQRVRCLAPGKKILHDDELDLDGLTEWINDRHADDVPVAIHCVTATQLVVAIAALRTAGSHPLDRIEHAAMVPDGSLRELAALGVTVVTQPNFVAERGDQYRHHIPADEQPQLWRVASLMRAGVAVAASTDAPFGALDPWAVMRAAVTRETPAGFVLGPEERIQPLQALQMFLGCAGHPAQPRRVAPGQPGDLCILSVPPSDALRALASDMVAATVVAGTVT
ncbi:MAG: amidohydrolase family protein [Mycobacteriaceae bacterium]|nr:amidohydrolase family protein [Mycobacteriaceae bacterium]